LNSKATAAERKLFRDLDKKSALSEAEKIREATLKKTAKLRALRLAKEAAERAEYKSPAKKTKPAKKRAL
jgi:hypothetical protein